MATLISQDLSISFTVINSQFDLLLAGSLLTKTGLNTQGLDVLVEQDESHLVSIFKQLHVNPELPFMKIETAALVAQEFRANSFGVHEGIAKTGVAGILRDGDGPVVMLRGDMDTLPIREETGRPYKCTAVKTDADGNRVPTLGCQASFH